MIEVVVEDLEDDLTRRKDNAEQNCRLRGEWNMDGDGLVCLW